MREAHERPLLAIALAYDLDVDRAPKVTAKGRGAVAEAILSAAREHDIAIEGDPLLAEALAGVDIDQEIPLELYRAVAEVIGFVVRQSGRM